MRCAVIEGGKTWSGAGQHALANRAAARVEDVRAEARRRLKSLNLDEWRMREFVTGHPIPDHIQHTAMQIEFACQAIERLMPVPEDYADDVYWPRV